MQLAKPQHQISSSKSMTINQAVNVYTPLQQLIIFFLVYKPHPQEKIIHLHGRILYHKTLISQIFFAKFHY